jgi:hypothetical protein
MLPGCATHAEGALRRLRTRAEGDCARCGDCARVLKAIARAAAIAHAC